MNVIRDPIHNIIPFEDTQCDRLLLRLINTKEFQRLRRIRQLGMSQYVFPGASHSRFAHSIGVMQMARRMLERLKRIKPREITPERETVVLVAALLHDVGHGPFSHTFEQITEEEYEARTLEIITDKSTEVNEVLCEIDPELPGKLRFFFDESVDVSKRDGHDVPVFLTQIVSSQLDADRFEYLLRDSQATGTDYGQFDLDWLLQHLYLDTDRERLYLGRKALFAAEGYVFARYHAYRAVYYHKTTRAAEVMLRLLFQRYQTLLGETTSKKKKEKIVGNVPSHVFRAFSQSQRMTLEEYLRLDDDAISEFCKACSNAQDSILQDLSRGLLSRKLYKARDASEATASQVDRFRLQVNERLQELSQNSDFVFAADSPGDTPYKLYDPDASKPNTQIYVATIAQGQKEIGDLSESVSQLKKQYELLRYYFPASLRKDIDEIGDKTLGKEKK